MAGGPGEGGGAVVTAMPPRPSRAVVLLATRDGARFLSEQLSSFETQTHPWELWWRDDGSTDETISLLESRGTRVRVGGTLGAQGCFLTLLQAAAPALAPGDVVAFADQDDVWLPEKLARGAAALGAVAPEHPAIYAARQIYTDARLRRTGLSARARRGGFPASLTQNLAVGCATMLNAAAARLVAASHPPESAFHDWWSYILVTAAGGTFLWDETPMVLYRQHPEHMLGAQWGWRRPLSALRRGPRLYMDRMRAHLRALEADAALITPEARAVVIALSAALTGGKLAQLKALATPGLRRQTRLENLLFRLWFLVG